MAGTPENSLLYAFATDGGQQKTQSKLHATEFNRFQGRLSEGALPPPMERHLPTDVRGVEGWTIAALSAALCTCNRALHLRSTGWR